ncbi:MAG: SDR family oxidoreductase [Flavobacteriales bacterium]|jgi:3-oxoacyl-[acyl-carrier protein] reductase|nr:SDR family oxidoreductase [Flavobacteriales bacterium]
MLLQNKIAVVTGGSRGIGKSISLTFAREGASLVLIAIENDESLQIVKKEAELFGAQVVNLIGDVSSSAFCDSIVKKTIETFGRVDILVNCAGTITRAPIEEMGIDEWHRVIDVNLHGAMYLSRKTLPSMRNQKYGKIINITSQMAHMPHPSASPSYEVSKSGMTALTRHLALQYAKYNINVNNIAPGSIDTDLPKSMTDAQRQRLKDAVPMQRLGETEEVADCALFLASDMASYITGSTIHINGGSLII